MSGFSIFVSWLGCTQMQEPGSPFSSVEIAKTSVESDIPTSSEEPVEKEEAVDPLFAPTGTILVVSDVSEETEESKENTEETSKIKVMVSEVSKQEQGQDVALNTKVEAPVLLPSLPVEKGVSGVLSMPTESTNVVSSWPLRVVKTEADLHPPRAILGLPSGEEVVVKAGMQLPNENLIVMSIGKKGVVLARIIPTGDHAQVQNITLMSLND